MTDETRKTLRSRLGAGLFSNLSKGVQNALEIARVGRLSPEVRVPFEVVHRERLYKLRHYPASAEAEAAIDTPILLVPPLMITPEVYDIDPSTSAIALLTGAGADVWVIDFGVPEDEEGGLSRTLDDHVRSVSQVIDRVRTLSGESEVHLAGYSQGGMFCYQAAAYRHSEGIKSLITFGSPVDIHRNMIVDDELATRMIDSVSGGVRMILNALEALPGAFSSVGFRVLSAGKEARQLLDFVSHLHDRDALVRGESSRRFLHGEGFVAWPGPALRSFFEQFVVQNRLSQGGFVIDGRTLTLADVTCPILYFVGERDEFARGPSVHAIRDAAPLAEAYDMSVRTGHFGLVVGSLAMKHTWPAVAGWLRFHEQLGPLPEDLRGRADHAPRPSALPEVIEANIEEVGYNARLLYDTAKGTAGVLRKTALDLSHSLTLMFDTVRYQLPRLAQLEQIGPESLVSVGRTLAERAERAGQNTFFLWQGRAHSYAEADLRVNQVVKCLIACDVKPGMRVGVLMHSRPTYLSLVAALSRLGAIAVLLPEHTPGALGGAIELGTVQVLICDPDHAALASETFAGDVLALGGGAEARELPARVRDLQRIDPAEVELPDWYVANPGRGRDVALIFFTQGRDQRPRLSRVTNRRWAVAAYGAAATSTLTAKDTVHCCMPLDHAAGLLVSVGGALVGGARLTLSGDFDPNGFWTEARRHGVTVVYYAGDMCRALVDAPELPGDGHNPVRLFAGSGMRSDVWKRLSTRFRTSVLEFYATTEGSAVLANVTGEKIGSLGKPLPGTSETALVSYDFETRSLRRGASARLERCTVDEAGILIARVDDSHPLAGGGADEDQGKARRVVRSAFEPGDAWFVTGDVLRVDSEGDYWFVDREIDMVRTAHGAVSSVHIEDVLYQLPELAQVVAYGVRLPGDSHESPVVNVIVRDGYALDLTELAAQAAARLDAHVRPRFVLVVSEIPLSAGYRALKQELRENFLVRLTASADEVFRYDAETNTYAGFAPEG
jgi:putative long chain acyl-CoA synthase